MAWIKEILGVISGTVTGVEKHRHNSKDTPRENKCQLASNLKSKQWHCLSRSGGSTCTETGHAKNNRNCCFDTGLAMPASKLPDTVHFYSA